VKVSKKFQEKSKSKFILKILPKSVDSFKSNLISKFHEPRGRYAPVTARESSNIIIGYGITTHAGDIMNW
jgi:hypothetical protein